MKSSFEKFDPEERIRSDADLVAILNDAIASEDLKYLLSVLGVIAKRQGLDEVAQDCARGSITSMEQILELFKTLNIKLQATITAH